MDLNISIEEWFKMSIDYLGIVLIALFEKIKK